MFSFIKKTLKKAKSLLYKILRDVSPSYKNINVKEYKNSKFICNSADVLDVMYGTSVVFKISIDNKIYFFKPCNRHEHIKNIFIV